MKTKDLNKFVIILSAMLLWAGCANSNSVRRKLEQPSPRRQYEQTSRAVNIIYGKASYYGSDFHGRKTASGEVFDMYALTAAHPELPFGTLCRVTNLINSKTVVVKINDRGPFVRDRVIDLSYGAAQELDGIGSGVMDVKIEILQLGSE